MKTKKPGFEAPVSFAIGGLKIQQRPAVKAPAKVALKGAVKGGVRGARKPGGGVGGKKLGARPVVDAMEDSKDKLGLPAMSGAATSSPSDPTHPKGGMALQEPGEGASSAQGVPVIQVPSLEDLEDDVIGEMRDSKGNLVAPPGQKRRVRQLSARNIQIGSRDAALQTKLVEDMWEQQYGVRPESSSNDPALPGMAALNNYFPPGVGIEESLIGQLRAVPGAELAVPDNPIHVFVTPLEGNSAKTRITGDFVIKGYESEEQAEVEWLGTKIMQLSGEITPDMHLASMDLRERIMAADPEYKMADRFESTMNPRRLEFGQPFQFTKTIVVEDPMHCLVMPKLFATNIGNIVEDTDLRASFVKNIKKHTREMTRMVFKDMILGNSDRVVRMYPGLDEPPYLPDLEEVAQGSPMNTGNIMFQTVNGEVVVGTGFAIDNYGYTVNKIGEEEGRAKELKAFKFYMEDVAASITGGPRLDAAPHHLVNQIMSSLRGALDSPELVLGEGADPLYKMPETEFRAAVIGGLRRGFGDVVANKMRIMEFLDVPEEDDPLVTEMAADFRELFARKVEIAHDVFKAFQ